MGRRDRGSLVYTNHCHNPPTSTHAAVTLGKAKQKKEITSTAPSNTVCESVDD